MHIGHPSPDVLCNYNSSLITQNNSVYVIPNLRYHSLLEYIFFTVSRTKHTIQDESNYENQ